MPALGIPRIDHVTISLLRGALDGEALVVVVRHAEVIARVVGTGLVSEYVLGAGVARPLDPQGYREDSVKILSRISPKGHSTVGVASGELQCFAEFTTNHSDLVTLGTIESPDQGGHRGGCVGVIIEIPVPDQSIFQGVLSSLGAVDLKNGFVT